MGPRINAAGRLDSAMEAFSILTSQNVQTAGRLAQILENINRERQRKTKEIQEKAEELALSKDYPNPYYFSLSTKIFIKELLV